MAMNFLRRNVKHLLTVPSPVISRKISNTPPPHLHQQFCTTVCHPHDPGSTRYETPPINWGFLTVPEKKAYVIERFGKYAKTLTPGFHLLLPYIDRIVYMHSLEEEVIPLDQSVISKDMAVIQIGGVLYIKIVDPKMASYVIEDPLDAVVRLAHCILRSELATLTLDDILTLEDLGGKTKRDTLNKIVIAINETAQSWGIKCLRYEIKDITTSCGVRAAIEMLAEAEHKKRALILESEREREAIIDNAVKKKQALILAAKAAMLDEVKRAQEEAEAIAALARAITEGTVEFHKPSKKTGESK